MISLHCAIARRYMLLRSSAGRSRSLHGRVSWALELLVFDIVRCRVSAVSGGGLSRMRAVFDAVGTD